MAELFLILTTIAVVPNDPGMASAGDVLICDFETGTDRDFDGWPDHWTRQRSRELPEFLKIGIQPETSGIPTNHCLQVDLDGGGAILSSPPCTVSAQFSLALSLRIRTAGLKYDGVWADLTLLDAEGHAVQSQSSAPLTNCPDWQTVQIGPLVVVNEKARTAVVTLHVQRLGKRDDLKGTVWFDDVRVVRLPRMQLLASSPTGLFTKRDVGPLVCSVSGIRASNPRVHFELFDHAGQRLAESTTGLVATQESNRRSSRQPADSGHAGQAVWTPPVGDYGYYRVRASLLADGASESLLDRWQSLAILRSLPSSPRSEFGWSLAGGEQPLAYGPLAAVLGQAGVGWAKIPIWHDVRDTDAVDRIAWFAEQLSIQGIDLVGVLDQPPPELRKVFRQQGQLPAASVFAEPELWQPALGPILTRLSLKVRWWQLGGDGDASFVGYPQLETKLTDIKHRIEQYGQQIRVGINWQWMYEAPRGSGPQPVPWSFLSYDGEPALTAEETASYLTISSNSDRTSTLRPGAQTSKPTLANHPSATSGGQSQKTLAESNRGAAPRRWMQLSPLPRDEYSQEARTRDLVLRLLAAKMHGARAVFLSIPFDDQQGVMNAEGSPSDLFVPWRTTAMLVGGSEYLGPLSLPGGNVGHVFARDNQAVMAVWSDRPVTERVYLGERVEQLDVWGRATIPALHESEGRTLHELPIGEMPTFVTGLSESVARWQAAVAFDDSRLATVTGREQTVVLRLKNTFPQGVNGELTLHAPKSWGFDTRPMRFKIAEGDELRLPIPVTLMPDASSGTQNVRLDFDVTGNRFSVHRLMQLGLDDVQVELTSRLKNGALLVEQHLTNQSDHPLSFQCVLFAPGRRRETRQVINLGRDQKTLVFVLPQGEELIGQKLWLRAEEIGGPRVLNFPLQAER